MLQNFLLNILLTLVWVALTGHLNYANFLFGFILGYFILWMLHRSKVGTEKEYFYRVPKILSFILYFLWDLMKANWEVAKDVITPNYSTHPGIVKFEMKAKTDFEITMFANIIALTPGTLVIDISEDKKYIYIHGMYLKDREKFVKNMRERTEGKLLEILR